MSKTAEQIAEHYQKTKEYPLGAAINDYTTGKLKVREVLTLIAANAHGITNKKAEEAPNMLQDWMGWDV